MDGPEGADAKDAEDADESDAKKATKDLDRLAKKDPSRFKKAVSHPLEAALQLLLPLIMSATAYTCSFLRLLCFQSGTACSVHM